MKLINKYLKDLNDYSSFKEVAIENQIIGLGEATHGNKEFHIVRANISKYLIESLGYSGVIMEFPYTKSENLNKYISTGKGDLNKILKDVGYWTCATEEIKDFIEWLRSYNNRSKTQKVYLYGNDVEVNNEIRLKPGKFRDKVMADKSLIIAKKGRWVLWAHNHHISKFYGGGFTSLGYYLSKKIKYFNVATLFYEGSLTAVKYDSINNKWGNIMKFKLMPTDSDALEYKLNQLKKDEFFLNIKELPTEVKMKFGKIRARFLGAGFDPDKKESDFQEMDFAKMFDGVIFIKKVTPSILL